MAGYGPANSSIKVILRTPQGDLKGRTTVSSNASGYWYGACVGNAETHDKVRATDGSTARTFKIPVVTARANRKTDVVSGRAKAGTDVTIYLSDCQSMKECTSFPGRVVHVSGTGHYSTDFTSVLDANGRDSANVYWTSSNGDSIYRYASFPWINATYHGNSLWGYAAAGQQVTLKAKTSSGSLLATTTTTADGYGNFSGEFWSANGAPVYLVAGMKIAMSTGGTLTMPSMSVLPDPASDSVSGTCGARQFYEVYAFDSTWTRPQPYSYAYGKSDATGHFTRNMANANYPTFDLQAGDEVQVRCSSRGGDVGYYSVKAS